MSFINLFPQPMLVKIAKFNESDKTKNTKRIEMPKIFSSEIKTFMA